MRVKRSCEVTGILYRRCLSQFIQVIDTGDTRMTAIKVLALDGPILIVNVYMPVDYGTAECVEAYNDACTNIVSLDQESEAVCLMVLGDFNCDCGKPGRFRDGFSQFMLDNDLVCSDTKRLDGVFTYCKDDGSCTSWIDHVVCSKLLDVRICDISVHYEYISSDHKPLTVTLSDVCCEACHVDTAELYPCVTRYDWSNANINLYQQRLCNALSTVSIPSCLLECKSNCCADTHTSYIDRYYNDVISCICLATKSCIPSLNAKCNAYNMPGWSDHVNEKHEKARAAFLEWAARGKPRTGPAHLHMCRTRAALNMQ